MGTRDKMLLWSESWMLCHFRPHPTPCSHRHLHRNTQRLSGAESEIHSTRYSKFSLEQKFFNSSFQRMSKIYKGLFRIAQFNDFIKKKEYPVMMLWTDWSLTLSVWSENQTGGRLDQVNSGWHGVDHTDSTHRHSQCQMMVSLHALTEGRTHRGPHSPRAAPIAGRTHPGPHSLTEDRTHRGPHSPSTRRLKKMVMPLDCSSCWACCPVCTGRMGLAGLGRTSFVVTARVVWRVTLKPSWVVLGNLLENIKSSGIRQRKKGPNYQHTHKPDRELRHGAWWDSQPLQPRGRPWRETD